MNILCKKWAKSLWINFYLCNTSKSSFERSHPLRDCDGSKVFSHWALPDSIVHIPLKGRMGLKVSNNTFKELFIDVSIEYLIWNIRVIKSCDIEINVRTSVTTIILSFH